jgi:hypothetical protein
MRHLLLALIVLATANLTNRLHAQGTADQARLMLSIGVGQRSGGGTLWAVGEQPFIPTASQTDTISLSRHFRRNMVVSMSGTYFPGRSLGLNVEVQLLGLGTEDQCSLQSQFPSDTTVALCNSINRAERSATSAAFSVGGIYRVASRQVIHPYARANVGVVITQHSFLRTRGTTDGGVSITELYRDDASTSVQPYVSFGGGIVTVIGRGYQFRFELRDNYVRLPAVSGATVFQGFKPPSRTVGKHLLTFIVAFDVVLERKRGRRY